MEREYVALNSIHHGRQDAPQSLSAPPVTIIPAGVFDPTALGLTEAEVLMLRKRGLILTAAEHEASLEKRRNSGGLLVVDGVSTNITRRVLKPHA